MKKYIFLILIVVRLSSSKAQQNYLIAGVNYDYYVNIEPDYELFGDYCIGYQVKNLDLDNDNNFDFKFEAFWSCGNGHVSRWIKIIPYSNNKIAISRIDTSNIHEYHLDTTYKYVAKIYEYSDTINDTDNFINTEVCLNYIDFWAVPVYTFNILDWDEVYDKYIGLYINQNDSNILFWLRVDVPFDSKIIFKDYSSKEQPNSASLQTNIFGTNMLDVYPNPAKNILNIKYQSEDNHSLKAFAIINSIGEIIYKGRFNENQESLALNIKNFKPGLYYFKANINGNIVSKKIVIN